LDTGVNSYFYKPKSERTDWIETYTGRQFWPLTPSPADVDIVDIAHALSLKCRFAGHCKKFYSVAEHSVIASYWVPKEHAKAALLHDAAEAYLADVSGPIKPHLNEWKEIERDVEKAIATRFDLQFPWHQSIKEVDRRLVKAEREQIMRPSGREWRTHTDVDPLPVSVLCLSATYAKRLFNNRARELGIV
jgi:hypothetical protein